MEDAARLAVVEQGVKDIDKFSRILYDFLQIINSILENPHDNNGRILNKDFLKIVNDYKELKDYLEYIGFRWSHSEYKFPIEQKLNKLMMAKLAIEKKISICCDPQKVKQILVNREIKTKKDNLKPVFILLTSNNLLNKIETLFNNVLAYEDEELQRLAKKQIPITTLKIRAMERMREHQKKIKTGDTKQEDMPYERALLMELVGWFKYEYFSWVDAPSCETCGGGTTLSHNTTMYMETEICRVEVYKCTICGALTKFPRYNDVRSLLRTRRGRCGEWANCFVMLARTLGYDARYVYDTTDHVWCEVFDFDTNSWCHVDPCEGVIDTPLMYSHGWGKKLSYVIAVSRDDIQDVTWRYTMNHKEVLSRRTECTEQELLSAILLLRAQRQAQVSEARRKYLASRTLRELVQLMVERKPSDYESHGRISGSKEWREQRGEIGEKNGHTFEFSEPGEACIRYYSSPDKYRITSNGIELDSVIGWNAGVYECRDVFRKIEKDWRQVYIAREEGQSFGSIAWKLSVKDGLEFSSLNIRLISAVYESGKTDWKLQFDSQPPIEAKLGDTTVEYKLRFKTVILTAHLTGGNGDVSWQHAQLFRQSLDSKASAFELHATIDKVNY